MQEIPTVVVQPLPEGTDQVQALYPVIDPNLVDPLPSGTPL